MGKTYPHMVKYRGVYYSPGKPIPDNDGDKAESKEPEKTVEAEKPKRGRKAAAK